MEAYPIDLDDIRAKVARKIARYGNRRYQLHQKSFEFDVRPSNVKEQINQFGEKLIRVDGEIPPDLPVNDGDRFLFISYDQTALSHGLHKYPAKFFPELPRWLIKRYSNQGDLVLDPFTGSGTTNVEALLNYRDSVGVDVDPFSRYLTKVKVTPLDPFELEESSDLLLKKILHFRPDFVSSNDVPDFPYRDNWFNEEIILELAYILKSINDLNFNNDLKDFYRICFSSIIRAVSNADDNCTRTVIRKKLNKQVYPADALVKFVEKILINVPKMLKFSKLCDRRILVELPSDCDARDLKYPDNYFDLAVTSPPYANAVDYPRTHQLESYWLSLAHGSLTPLKKQHVGTESVSVEEYSQLHQIEIPEADEVIENIYRKDKRRAFIAYKYLRDMQFNLKEVYRVIKPESRYVIVVGNNRIRGQLFENWLYILKIADKVGFQLEIHFASEIIKHFIKVPREERINTDWVLVLRK